MYSLLARKGKTEQFELDPEGSLCCYDNLMTARLTSNLVQWIKFFLVGVIETSQASIQVFKDIIALKTDLETNRLPRLGNKIKKAQQLLKQLFPLGMKVEK